MQTYKTQVLVVGSGAAGICAALASARNGAKTLLIDSNGFLGGISATLPWLGFHDRDYRLLVKGLPLEITGRLRREGAASDFVLDPKCGSAISIDNHSWKCLAVTMADEAGLDVLLKTQLVETLREGDRIAGAIVLNKSGLQMIHADVVIDCSGDGDVAAHGGVQWDKGREADGLVQAPSLGFRLAGVDPAAFLAACKNKDLNYREWISRHPGVWERTMRRIDSMDVIICGGFAGLVEQARKAGDLTVPQTRIVGVRLHRRDQFLVVMSRVLGLNPVDGASLSGAYTRTYQQIPELVRFFRKWVPGFANAFLDEIAPILGVRESRRIVGDYVLTGDDLVAGRHFDDAVSMGGYHIDIHRPSGTWVDSRNVRAYTIPYRSLVAAGVDGLLMAGKCMSATHEAVASTRVVPICMGEGQAAGTAAALAVKAGISPREVPIAKLQSTLIHQGAETGQSVGAPDLTLIDQIGQPPFEEESTTGDRDAASSFTNAWLGPATPGPANSRRAPEARTCKNGRTQSAASPHESVRAPVSSAS
ncbi:MAG: FAD-dependent oxidoreductase [Opitutaceae bacterium]|jgi:hypothetical protein|nr:FAD-dependent oxidoreductase [Opitutaceae bacterium]